MTKPLVRQQAVHWRPNMIAGGLLPKNQTSEQEVLPLKTVRWPPDWKGMRLVVLPARAPSELAREEVEHIPWLRRRLLSWFARDGRTFPWREPGRMPYEVVVAEILLQRTTATGLACAYAGFIERFPSWAALAQAPMEELEDSLRPLGLWRQKALAFQHLAQSIEERGGLVPRTRTELELLPGIGPYTASAVLAIVYGRAEPLLDVNMARLLGRFLGSLERTKPRSRRSLQALALCLISSKRSLEVNWAVLDFGALVCKAGRPLCRECPLRTRCAYARSRTSNLLPLQMFLQAHEALVADDNVVDQFDDEDAAGIH